MQKGIVLLWVGATLLAGCATPPSSPDGTTATETTTPPATGTTSTGVSTPTPGFATATAAPSTSNSNRMTIRGVVFDTALRPLQATVQVLETNASQETGAGGTFRFEDLRRDVYFLTATARGFRSQTLSVTPEAAEDEVRFQLEANPSDAPYNTTIRFRGTLGCALEVLIVSPACDSLITSPSGLNRPDLAQFNATNSIAIDVQEGWKTVVVDVVFKGSDQAGLDGLRVTVQGTRDQSGLGTYEQYGRFNGQDAFTFRLRPGDTYSDTTVGPVPHNTTAFRFEVFPQSHGWHALCVPPGGGTCFLGVGAGLNVNFDLFITTFYGLPAPEGFTFRSGA